MASTKALHNPWNIRSLLVYIFMIQFHFSKLNCTTTQFSSSKKTFYLVHGLGHGAWCWFKLIPLLEAAGHNVVAMDLSASGIDPRQIQDIQSFNDYSAPLLDLLDSLPNGEKVILVGHSFGGMSLALAMEMYPNKISVAVFVSAFLPDTVHVPSYVLAKYIMQVNTTGTLMDSQVYLVPRLNQTPLGVVSFGPNALKYSLYQLSPKQDLELAKSVVRPSSLFVADITEGKKFTEEGFGSVRKVYIQSEQDKTITIDFQRWMIENEGSTQVKEINNADHMTMISRPKELCNVLLKL